MLRIPSASIPRMDGELVSTKITCDNQKGLYLITDGYFPIFKLAGHFLVWCRQFPELAIKNTH